MPLALRRMLRAIIGLLVLFQFPIQAFQESSNVSRQAAPTSNAASPLLAGNYPEASFILDGVVVTIRIPFEQPLTFYTSQPGNAAQVAAAASWRPFREVSVTAVPFGTKPGTEALPVAYAGARSTYLEALRKQRIEKGGRTQSGPMATIFGEQVVGQASVVSLNLDSQVPKPTLIVEWVVEAGNRLWIVRVSEEQPADVMVAEPEPATLQTLGKLTMASTTLGAPSTLSILDNPVSKPETPDSKPADTLGTSISGDLPTPAWWNGSDCDYNHYYAESGGTGSYRLGAVYLGMPACGPRPYHGGPDVLVRFFPGAWGEYEWECVELAMRYLYLAYGINPYPANGSGVVWNYSGSALQKIGNGTIGAVPQPGDVLSYGPTSSYGHASVVSASSVDGSGNGSITVIEENNSSNGASTLSVTNWTVNGNAGSVSGWLHFRIATLPNKTFLPAVLRSY